MYFCIETKCYGYENKNNTEDTVCQCIVLLDIGKLPVAGLDVLRSCGRKIRENALNGMDMTEKTNQEVPPK